MVFLAMPDFNGWEEYGLLVVARETSQKPTKHFVAGVGRTWTKWDEN